MARAIKLLLVLSIIGVAFCAPTEDVTTTEAATTETGHASHAKGKSISDWVKKPVQWGFDIGHKSVDFGMNITKKAMNVSEKITETAIEMAMKPVDFVGDKIASKVSRTWGSMVKNGVPANVHEYSFAGRILKGRSENNIICGCVIVSASYVLTAAHCLDGIKDPSEISIYAGSQKLLHNAVQIVQVEEIEKRSSYNPETLTFDLAVLKLATPLKFTKEVSSIALPNKSDYDAENINEGKAVVLGTSKINILLSGNVNVRPVEECAQYFTVYYNQMCITGEEVSGVRSCVAEAGFPIVQKVDGQNVLIGLVSYTNEECHPVVGVRISKHLTWLKKIMNE